MAYGKDMSKVYFHMDDLQLRMLRARKARALQKAQSFNTFFTRVDTAVLEHQIMQMDAVLEARERQLKLL